MIHEGPYLMLLLKLSLHHPQHEAAHEEPLDELYEALAEILTAEEPTQCHRSYLLVGAMRLPPHTGQTPTSAHRFTAQVPAASHGFRS